MALQVFYHCQNHLLFPLNVRCPSAILIFLQDFLRLAFFPFILRYILRITFTSNKVFYFSQVNIIASHLPKIQLKLERKAWFYLPKTFDFLFQKHLIFYSGKRMFLETTVLEFSIVSHFYCLPFF